MNSIDELFENLRKRREEYEKAPKKTKYWIDDNNEINSDTFLEDQWFFYGEDDQDQILIFNSPEELFDHYITFHKNKLENYLNLKKEYFNK